MTKRCGRPTPGQSSYNGCQYERMKGKQRCVWHWLLSQPPHLQETYAGLRLQDAIIAQGGADSFVNRARVPDAEWPEGERWCSGCQTFVPLFYCSGSRCRACSSKAAHESRVQKLYDLAPGEYDALFTLQAGRCFICRRKFGKKRPAVDHDHATGAVRGLLCANNEHGCNAGVLGNLEAAEDGGLAAARRTVLYLTLTPYQRLKTGRRLSWESFVGSEHSRFTEVRLLDVPDPPDKPPPF